MWQLIGWFILFLCVMSIEDKINKLCKAENVICVEERK